jgi:hypothetical protein
MKTVQRTLVLLLCTTTLLLSGCVKLWQKNLDIKTYMVEAPRNAAPAELVLAHRLWIDKVNVLPPFNVRSLIVRKSDVEYQTSYYTELLMSPSENYRNVFYTWFADSKLFENVTIVDRKDMSHRMVVTVMKAYGDQPSMHAVLKIKVTLFDEQVAGMKVLFSNDYEQVVEVAESDADRLVRAFNVALTEILTQCEQDVVSVLR